MLPRDEIELVQLRPVRTVGTRRFLPTVRSQPPTREGLVRYVCVMLREVFTTNPDNLGVAVRAVKLPPLFLDTLELILKRLNLLRMGNR